MADFKMARGCSQLTVRGPTCRRSGGGSAERGGERWRGSGEWCQGGASGGCPKEGMREDQPHPPLQVVLPPPRARAVRSYTTLLPLTALLARGGGGVSPPTHPIVVVSLFILNVSD